LKVNKKYGFVLLKKKSFRIIQRQ